MEVSRERSGGAAGGVDVDIDKRKKFERIYGIKSFSSLEKFKQSKINIDLLIISVPTKLQVEVIKNSLKILQNFDIDILLFGTFISQNWRKNGKCFQTKITLFRLQKKYGTIHHQPLHSSERYSQNQKFVKMYTK